MFFTHTRTNVVSFSRTYRQMKYLVILKQVYIGRLSTVQLGWSLSRSYRSLDTGPLCDTLRHGNNFDENLLLLSYISQINLYISENYFTHKDLPTDTNRINLNKNLYYRL